jgi:hypothetical protein
MRTETMMKRFNRIVAFAAMVTAVTLCVGGRAEAALRLTVTDGTTTDVFYSSDSTSLFTGTFALGVYTGQIQTVTSSYPGDAVAGTLSTTGNVGRRNPGASGPLTINVDVINGVASLDAGLGTNGIVTGSNASAVTASTLLAFTGPDTTPVNVSATSSPNATGNVTVTAGSLVVTTNYNGAAVASASAGIKSLTGTMTEITLSNSGTYTLGQTLVLSNLNSGARSTLFTGNSDVASAPEPATIAMVLSGLPLLGFAAFRSRRKTA